VKLGDSSLLKSDARVARLVVPDIWKGRNILIFRVKELQMVGLLDPEFERRYIRLKSLESLTRRYGTTFQKPQIVFSHRV
jgi:hypothetical protein